MQDCTLEEIICAWFSTQKGMSSYEVLDNSVRRGKVFKWEPARDDIWIFKTGHIDYIKTEELILRFEENFRKRLITEGDIKVLPIALINSKREVMLLTSLAIAHFRKNKEISQDNQKKIQKISLDINNQTKMIIESSPIELENVIIFKISMMDFPTILEFEEILTDLTLEEAFEGLLKSSSHYQLNDPKSATPKVLRVTLFDYDCDEN